MGSSRRAGCLKICICIIKLDVIGTKGAASDCNVCVCDNSHGALSRRTDHTENASGLFIIISEGKAGARLDLQMYSIECRRTECQSGADKAIRNVRLHVIIFRAAEHLCAVRRGCIDAAIRQLCRFSGRANGIRIRHRQRAAAVIDVIRLRAEHRRAGRRRQQSGGKQRRCCLFHTRFHSAPRCFVRVVIRKIRHFIIIIFCALCKCFSMAKRPLEIPEGV